MKRKKVKKSKVFIFISLLCLLLLGFSSGHGGADQPDFPLIYVNEGCAGTHVGSQANPYDTLSEINWTTSGDNSVYDYLNNSPSQSPMIHLNKDDTWREQLTIGCSGTATYPIIITNYGSGTDAVINGSDLVSTWTAVTDDLDYVMVAQAGGDYNMRTAIAANDLSSDGTEVRVQLTGDMYSGTTVVGTYIGEKASAGDAFDMESGTVTKITWDSGNDGTTIGASATKWSDWVAYSFDHTKNYIMSLGLVNLMYSAEDSMTSYYKGGASADAGVANVSGYTIILRAYFTSFEVKAMNVWQSTYATESNLIFFDGTRGTKESAISNLNASNEWFWVSNILYVYSTSDPDTAYTDPGIEAGKRDYCVNVNSQNYIIIQQLKLVKANSANVLLNATNQSDLNYCLLLDGIDGVELDTTGSKVQNCVIYGNTNGIDVDAAGYLKNTIIRNCTDDLDDVGGTPETWAAWTMDTDAGSGDYNLRTVIPSESFVANGDEIQVKIEGNTISPTILDSVYIGEVASAGDAWDMESGTVTEILFDSESGFSIDAGETITSDWITYAFDKTKNYIISYGIGIGGYFRCEVGSGQTYYKGGARAEAGTADVTGYTGLGNAYLLDEMKVRLAGASINKTTNNIEDDADADPLMIDSANGDFVLQKTSSCRDAGTEIGLGQDYNGSAVPKGSAPDIGAFEYFEGAIWTAVRLWLK